MSNETNASSTRHPLRRALVAALLLITLASLLLGRSPAVAQTDPTASPPAPTPSPADAQLAAKLARDGEYEAAIGAYIAVIAQAEPDERLTARLALARVYLDDDQAGAAASQLDAYLLEAPAGIDVLPAQYLLAQALARQDDWPGALPLYEAYVDAGGGASAYARLGQAEALARLGRGAEADQAGQRALEEALPPAVRASFDLRMAQALEELFPNEARAWYERLLTDSESPADQALALWRSAVIQRGLGNGQVWMDAWVAIIQRFPATATAQTIVDDPPPTKGAGVQLVDPYYTGLVYYRAGRAADARERFDASLDANQQGPDVSLAARSTFYLAVLDERSGATNDAIDGYGRVVTLDARVELADDALWWQARLLEEASRTTEATTVYQRLASEYGDTDWASEARVRVGLLALDAGRADDAARVFAGIAAQAQDEERQRALLWQGKALDEAGDSNGAQAIWRLLRDEATDGYYGLRAGVLLGEHSGVLSDAGLDAEDEPAWLDIEAWLEQTAGVDASTGLEALWFNPRWGLGQELLAIGAHRQASAEFGALLEDAGGDPAVLYQLARFYDSLDAVDLAARSAARLLGTLPDDVAESAPADLWRVAYPAPYTSLLREAADEGDVPDVLMLAVVRQESFFDPRAGSSAGALGLTQVIPLTGEAIASDLGIADFAVEQLFRPGVSLRFGAYYLGQQLDAFDGNVYHALAAYNGGPGNAERWARAADGDVDRFVEEVSFAQTRLYVKLVSENLARYRQLYLGLDAPQLPQDQ
ncbi:MAG: transglycosylase SLT domain-containing protein [Dehalococcoidia bacterium]